MAAINHSRQSFSWSSTDRQTKKNREGDEQKKVWSKCWTWPKVSIKSSFWWNWDWNIILYPPCIWFQMILNEKIPEFVLIHKHMPTLIRAGGRFPQRKRTHLMRMVCTKWHAIFLVFILGSLALSISHS